MKQAPFHHDLTEKLVEAFPIWVCRKQAVSYLFPCREGSFDLVVVDEATQCRVDDALPILFRASKVLVVGDEKQTVLAKNSVVDDYLFKEFSLEEHLRQTQARGMKAGGSHLFGLVKGIKQAHVMLDEHYRCPPDIIEYSNRYVYGGNLKKMQWSPEEGGPSVYVDYGEKSAPTSGRQSAGQFKGLETKMIDRFLEFVSKTIASIERDTGRRVNVETDVALCYFLLKNEPYIKRVKPQFLATLGRGSDVLDGAGAALQGKERDYIFYFWDINRGNMASFRQGDDELKRKGELNVLMSRPKKRAYHYLHKAFDQLDHSKATVADYLWNAYRAQSQKRESKKFVERSERPGRDFVPWKRSSGQMLNRLIDEAYPKGLGVVDKSIKSQYTVTVGDPRYCVDLMITTKDSRKGAAKSVGVVDLCGFGAGASGVDKDCADQVVDYFFQLKRASPGIRPVFLFVHEVVDARSRGFKRFMKALAPLKDKKKTR